MDHITTYSGEDFTPLDPSTDQIHIEDIAHALSLICRANGHISNFYSIAQHSINCANEAKARGFSIRIQIACLLHDASEAYLSDITKPVKKYLPEYLKIEKRLQDAIYEKFLGSPLTGDELTHIDQIDNDVLASELSVLMKKTIIDTCPELRGKPSFEFCSFGEIEDDFIRIFMGIKGLPVSESRSLRVQIAKLEQRFKSQRKSDVLEYVEKHGVSEMLVEKLNIKKLSAQVDVFIHAYGILLVLPKILDDNEVIEYLSLGAGSTGKAFDLSTTKRIAEFKFAQWDKDNNTIRQNNIFKDFLELAISDDGNGKIRCLYCLSATEIIQFLSNSERNLGSVLSRNSIGKKYVEYQKKYGTVKKFYMDFMDKVEIVELGNYLRMDL